MNELYKMKVLASSHCLNLLPATHRRLCSVLSDCLMNLTFKHGYRSLAKNQPNFCIVGSMNNRRLILSRNISYLRENHLYTHYQQKGRKSTNLCDVSFRTLNPESSQKNRDDLVTKFKSSLSRGKVKHFYMFDGAAADRIINVMNPYLDSESQVIEVFPGAGLLSQRFLKTSIKKLICLEPRVDLIPVLKENIKNDSRMEYDIGKNINFMMFKKMLGLKPEKWTQDSKLKFFVVIPTSGYFFLFNRLPKALVHQDFIYRYGRVPVFCLMTRKRLDQYVNKKDGIYKTRHAIFYNLLFDVEVLDEMDRNLFDPVPKCEQMSHDDDILLVKILPKENVLEIFGSLEKLRGFHFFTTQLMLRKHDRVIPRLEHWAPGCGSRLIAQGYSMMDKVLSMSVDSLVELYFDFVNWPELKDSSFLAALGHHTGTEESSFCEKVRNEKTPVHIPEEGEENHTDCVSLKTV